MFIDFRIYSQNADFQYIAIEIYIKKISICLIYVTHKIIRRLSANRCCRRQG